jgi:DNA invertase Pin-like site-specific DNA recombinase
VRLSTLDLRNVKAALAKRSAILTKSQRDENAIVKTEKENLFGEDVKMVRKITQRPKLLTPAEKNEVVKKYESGMSMMAIAELYGCHYTTVGRILRQKGVVIRE